MKLRCIKINSNFAPVLNDYFKVGHVYEAKRRHNIYLNAFDINEVGSGVSWCAVQKGGKFNISIPSGPIATFVLAKCHRRLVVTEKRIADIRFDKRRARRLFRQYGKLRFTEPGMFCFIAFAAMKKNARNHKR